MPAIHPLLVHFPVALLLTGTLAVLWSFFRPEKSGPGLYAFTSGALGLGYAGLVMTVATGLYDLQASPKAQARDGWVVVTVIHLACGVLLLAVYGFMMYRRFFLWEQSTPPTSPEPPVSSLTEGQLQTETLANPVVENRVQPRLDKITLALAIAGLILLVVAAYLGGMLVYEYRVGVQ
jgi:uncharacterized membrane protein